MISSSSTKFELSMAAASTDSKHFILVHGVCHGAWCWYKLATLLRAAGHSVTAVDLAASGVDPQRLHELRSFRDYVEPLLHVIADSVPPCEKAILVGHSFGGASLALAMESFPDKVAVAVFVNAVMPSATSPMAGIAEEFFKRHPLEAFMDSEVLFNSDFQTLSSIKFGAKYMASRLYQLCSPEDLTLATMLLRPGSFFLEDLSSDGMLTEDKHGSVKRVFVLCKEDLSLTEEFQRWMIDRCPGTEVKEIEGADHSVMLSKPKDLGDVLLEIASNV